jgi:hypothetical protein
MKSPEENAKAQRTQSLLFNRVFPTIGAVGLAIAVTLNLAALLIFKKTSAEFFSPGWWSSWFPSYVVWLTFLAMGFGGMVVTRGSRAK